MVNSTGDFFATIANVSGNYFIFTSGSLVATIFSKSFILDVSGDLDL